MALALLLMWKRTRFFAMVGGLLVILGIEVFARELFFGMFFANGMLMFHESPPGARVRAAFGLPLVYFLGWIVGLLPPVKLE